MDVEGVGRSGYLCSKEAEALWVEDTQGLGGGTQSWPYLVTPVPWPTPRCTLQLPSLWGRKPAPFCSLDASGYGSSVIGSIGLSVRLCPSSDSPNEGVDSEER